MAIIDAGLDTSTVHHISLNLELYIYCLQHQILKRKLQSKSEALLIISKDLDKVQNERDQFKTMAEKLQERCQV